MTGLPWRARDRWGQAFSRSGTALRTTLLAALAVLLVPAAGMSAAPPSGPAPPPLPPTVDSGVEGLVALRGQFVAGAAVLAFAAPGPGPNDRPQGISPGSDESGRYRLVLKPGSYHLVAVKTAGAPWPFPAAKGDLFCYHLGNPVVVEPGKMTRVGFNMVRIGDPAPPAGGAGAGVAGQVLFEDRPLGRAYVHVYRDASTNFRGMGLATVPTGEDGRFRIKLPAGSYFVLARKRLGGGMYGPPGKDDYIGYFPGNPVTVRVGAFTPVLLETTTRVDLLEELWSSEGEGAGWFEGSVTEPGGKPAAGLYVLFYLDEAMSGTPAFVAGPTDAKGRFRVRAAAGRFHLLARSNLGGPLEAGEWHGKATLPAGGAPAGGIRIAVTRYQGN